MISVTKAQAKQFLLQKQLLVEPPHKGPSAIDTVFQRLRIVQYDPLNPFGRNPDLILRNRVKDYHPEDYYRWLYKEHKGIECYDKVLCIVPIEDFPFTAHNRTVVSQWPQFKTLLKDRHADFEDVLSFIDKNGPTSSKDIANQEIVPGMGWYGYGSRWGKVSLEILWKTGQIVISKRVKGNKYYDLPKKVYGKAYVHGDDAITKEHLVRRVKSVGLLRMFGTTDAWRGLGSAKQRNELKKQLLNEGELVEVHIKDITKPYLIHKEDSNLFLNEVTYRDEMLFIAPLDMLIWDRDMIEQLFGFRYRWEVYVPADKRKFGYYVLPILYKDQFLGRIEPTYTNNTFEIKNIWKEPGVTWDKHMENKLDEAIETFSVYLEKK